MKYKDNHVPWNKGKKGHKRSLETRKKMSESQKRAWAKGKKKSRTNENYGHKHTEKSKRKLSLWRTGRFKGENAPNWKGGITQIGKLVRGSLKYKKWRQDVFIKDNFTCQKCGEEGGYLHAHHHKKKLSSLIQEVSVNLPLLNIYEGCLIYNPIWDVGNGQTQCVKCHKQHHKVKGK